MIIMIIIIISPRHINTGLASSGEKRSLMGSWITSVMAESLPRDGASIKILVVVAPYHHYPQNELNEFRYN